MKKVAQYKKVQKIPLKNAPKNQCKKVCKKIAELKSTQEFEPILGPMVQLAKCDPLHLRNNCWGHWHMLLFNYVMTKAKIGNAEKSVYQLPETNPSRKHLEVLKFKMKCKSLYNKIVRWFKEKHGKSNFEFRFTGEETKKFCDGFMHLFIATLDDDNIEKPSNIFPLSLYKMGIHLRNSVSHASRVSNISKDDLPIMERECRQYFNVASLFHTVNLSV